MRQHRTRPVCSRTSTRTQGQRQSPEHKGALARRTLAFVPLGGGNSERSASRAVLAYNLWRLGLLAICLGVGWLAGLRSFPLIVTALFASGVLSWFLLRRQREAMGMAVERTVERSRVRLAARTAAEDSYVDAMLAEQPTTSTSGQPATAPGDQPTS
jgi:Protein of unknown function (DUF4229)